MPRPDGWIIFATVVAFIIKGMTGFANTLVFTSIMSFGSANIEISPVELLTGYPSNLYIAWRERKSISIGSVLKISLLVILGSIPGAFLLKNTDTSLLKIIFGVLVILLGIEMLLEKNNRTKRSQIVFLQERLDFFRVFYVAYLVLVHCLQHILAELPRM